MGGSSGRLAGHQWRENSRSESMAAFGRAGSAHAMERVLGTLIGTAPGRMRGDNPPPG